jgi:cell wall-associated NlpC family hydrolase
MRQGTCRLVLLAAVALCALAACGVAAPLAAARSFSDVGSGCWAKAQIDWVTGQGPVGQKALVDFGSVFKPKQGVTRAQLARALVIMAGHEGETVTPRDIPDMPPGEHPYYWDVQLALHYGYMTLIARGGVTGFYPDAAMTGAGVETAVVNWLKARYPRSDWTMLKALRNGVWQPSPGWRPTLPSYFAADIAARQLGLRLNHPSDADALEVLPHSVMDRAEAAYVLRQAAAVTAATLQYSLPKYDAVTLPALSVRQKQVLQFALKFVGYPYVWAGEWPTTASPYGPQAMGGFDCSGFTFYVMQCHFGYPVTGRGAHDQAALAKPRIGRKALLPGDLIFFGYHGTKSAVIEIYHAALYMGNGWFIQSTGSTDGVSIANLDDPCNNYWRTYFAWGRRLLSPAELAQ